MSKNGKRTLTWFSIAGFAFMIVSMTLVPFFQTFIASKSGGACICFFPCKDYMDETQQGLNIWLTYFIYLPVMLFFAAILWLKYFIFVILGLMLLYGLTGYIPQSCPLGNIPPDDGD
jgi:hypothetical protein